MYIYNLNILIIKHLTMKSILSVILLMFSFLSFGSTLELITEDSVVLTEHTVDRSFVLKADSVKLVDYAFVNTVQEIDQFYRCRFAKSSLKFKQTIADRTLERVIPAKEAPRICFTI